MTNEEKAAQMLADTTRAMLTVIELLGETWSKLKASDEQVETLQQRVIDEQMLSGHWLKRLDEAEQRAEELEIQLAEVQDA